MDVIYDARIGSYLLLSEAISYAHGILLRLIYPTKDYCVCGRVSGVVVQQKHEVEALGKVMKERNLACDAVNFGDQSANKKELFDTLIAAMDNNGNWHILHIKHPCPIGHALSRSPVIHQVAEGESGIAGVGSVFTATHDFICSINISERDSSCHRSSSKDKDRIDRDRSV
ncbi:hypothetical protein Tco_0847291 [Tanacetum coccineum]